jgi:uncharacterized protein YgiM (DUF1202 family)
MTKNYGWGVLLLSLGAMVIGTSSPANAALTGQCRAAKQATGLYRDRNSSSALVSSLKLGDKVTLAEETASNNMILVSTPSKGFVQTVNLKMCPGAVVPVPPKPSLSSCRLVTQPMGLAIRKGPGGTNEVVGGVGQNEKITLVTPPEDRNTNDGRTWIKISKPAEGWVSEGFVNGGKNVAPCP